VRTVSLCLELLVHTVGSGFVRPFLVLQKRMKPEETMKVAVIGTGIAGLAAGFFLSHEPGCEVTLFEKTERIGMDSHCVMVEKKDGSTFRLNTPPRSFSKEYYPNLMELYRVSGVEIEHWSWSWVSFLVGKFNPQVRVGRRGWLFGWPLPTYLDLRNPWETLEIWRDGIKFSTSCERDFGDPTFANMTLGQYARDHLGLSDTFMYQALLPTLSMVCTCSYESCLQYPAELVMQFYARTATFGQYRTKYGTSDAVEKLTKKISEKRIGVNVKRIEKRPDGKLEIVYSCQSTGKDTSEVFDHVVMATQANHAKKLLCDEKSRRELGEVLGSFVHETSQVVIHRDERVMPGNQAMWAPMSVGVSLEKPGKSMFTIFMNETFPDLKYNVFQTWNPIVQIEKDLLLDEPIAFERPVMAMDTHDALKKLSNLQGLDNIWFAGAWQCWRIPLQESGVMSAIDAVRRMTGKIHVNGKWVVPEQDFGRNKEAISSTFRGRSSSLVFFAFSAFAAFAAFKRLL